MAFVMTEGCTVLDEFDVSDQITTVSFDSTADMVEITSLKNGGYRHYAKGLVMATSTLSGMADFASGGAAAEFPSSGVGGSTVVATFVPQGFDTEGDRAILHRGLLNTITAPTGAVGDVAGMQLASQGTSAQTWGYVAAPLTSYGTGGLTGTGINIAGPATDETMWAHLHVTAASGTDLAVKLQSDDNSGFTTATDRITFSTVSAVGAQSGSVAGDLSSEDYWRVVITVASGTFSALCVFGIA